MAKGEAEKQARIENFELIRADMRNRGFEETVCTVSVLKANLLALITAAPIIGVCLALYIGKWRGFSFSVSLPGTFLLLTLMIAGIVAHELLHGLTWRVFCKRRWKSIHFGVMWEVLTPYCHCKEVLSFGAYILGGLMPLIILGVGLFVPALLLGNEMLLSLSLINILGAGGDMTIALLLLKHKKALIYDHPTECGFVAFSERPGAGTVR